MENEEGKPNAHGQRADIGLKLTVSGITLKSQSSPNSRVFYPCPIREFLSQGSSWLVVPWENM